MEQARMILAIALSMAVIAGYSYYYAPPPPSATPAPQPSSAPAQVASPSSVQGTSPPAGLMNQGVPFFQAFDSSQKASPIFVENDQVHLALSETSATLSSWALDSYHETTEEGSPRLDLLTETGDGEALLISLGDAELDNKINYRLIDRQRQGEAEILVFEWQTPDLKVKKTLTLGAFNDPHAVDVALEVTNTGTRDFFLEPRIWVVKKQRADTGDGGFFSQFEANEPFMPLYYQNNELHYEEEDWAGMAAQTEKRGAIRWTALTDRFFLLGLISRQTTSDLSIRYGKTDQNRVYTSLSYGKVFLKASQSMNQQFSAYLGPKKRGELGKLGVALEASVDYGFFSFMAIPLLWLLVFFESWAGNWGLAIILLTFVVKLLLHPVNKKAMLSMKAMQKLHPQMKELREKYKGQNEKMQMELMQLFKSHKINPMGGCLPMALQMPVYFALYQVLWNAVEIYHAPFFWFYQDLSAPDPYYISPILLGVGLMLQQKLTPTPSADPAQQKVMMLMPVMFAGFMIFFPFGLVLYIAVNTFMSVIQQYMMHQDLTFVGLLKKLTSRS